MNLTYLKIISAVASQHDSKYISVYHSYNRSFIRAATPAQPVIKFTLMDDDLFKVSIYSQYAQYDLTNASGWTLHGTFNTNNIAKFDQDYFLMETMEPYRSILKQCFPNHHQSLFV